MTNEEKILKLLEQHSAMLEKQGAEIVNINLTLENRIFSQLQLLAEGQKTILEALTPKSRVEALEDEMSFMKQVIRAMSSEIQELKKAQ